MATGTVKWFNAAKGFGFIVAFGGSLAASAEKSTDGAQTL